MHQRHRNNLLLRLLLLQPLYLGAAAMSSGDIGFFWHITDMHWDPTYNVSGPSGVSCSPAEVESTGGSYGNYLCDSPWLLINSSVQAMRQIKEDVDFLIWTGDDTPHNANNASKDEVADIIRNLTQQLLDVFPNTTIFPVLGNHDWSPKSQIPPRNDIFYGTIADIWSPWLSIPSVSETFRRSGFYSTKLNDKILLVGLNSNLYYDSNQITASMPDPGNQLQWLDDTLTQASESRLKVLLIGHVPPGQFEKHEDKHWFRPYYNQIFVELLRKHNRVFGSLHFGHHHTDTFRLFYDDKGTTVGSFFVAPAVTPWETTLPGVMGGAGNNPGVRLVQYNRTSATVINVLQYYLNLTKANSRPQGSMAQWELAYNATAYYDQPDMTTASLKNLVDRMWTDDALFDKYYKANGLYFDMNEKWSSETRSVHCCAITQLDYKNYTTCRHPPKPETSISSRSAIDTLLLLILLLACSTMASR